MYSLASCQVDGSASPYVRWRSRHPTKHGAWHNALISGLEVSEVAQELGIPEGTVKSRLYYARRQVAAGWKEIARHWEDE